jgi:microcystin-dependent protein
MAEPFLGELRLMSFNFAPRWWATCSGQLMPINQNQALFSLLGTMYGGDGQTSFALPDLRGRVPLHRGGGWIQGQRFGEEFHVLAPNQLPQHNHALNASSAQGDAADPTGRVLAAADNAYRPATSLVALSPASIDPVGGSQAHENRPPSLVLSWCIAIIGIFPSWGD